MFEIIFVIVLCVIIAWQRLLLINKEVELTDLRLKYKFSQDTLNNIVESRRNEQ